MEESNPVKVPREMPKSVSPSEGNRLSKTGKLFETKAPAGSVITWRYRAGAGGAPNRVAMSDIKPLEKNIYSKFCQCSDAIVDATTFDCTICNEHFDAMENKKLVSYRMIGV